MTGKRSKTAWLGFLFIGVMIAGGCGHEETTPAATNTATPGNAAPAAQASQPVTAFEADGVIIAVHAFFDAAKEAGEAEIVAEGVADKALVTADGVYSFIETPENKQQLAAIAPGTAVRVTGMIHHPGRLLHVESITELDEAPAVNTAAVAADPGRQVTLTGANKCQCGIKISELHTSCSLGHLHHLEADDGKLYHYLQVGAGRDLFQGKGTHFKNVQVTGTVFPGQWVLVEAMRVP